MGRGVKGAEICCKIRKYFMVILFMPGSARHAPGGSFKDNDYRNRTSLLIGIVGELERSELK